MISYCSCGGKLHRAEQRQRIASDGGFYVFNITPYLAVWRCNGCGRRYTQQLRRPKADQ